jgi:radical SAM protein with 4Fe4S-binding SPASM domain
MNNIFPNVEIATRIGRATEALTLTNGESCRLIETLRKIDREEFGIKWSTAHSSIPGHSCGIFLTGAAVKADRGVALCPEMRPVASLADRPLSQIIQEPPFSAARFLEKRIEKPCSSCEFLGLCLGGCRSKALVHYGSVFSPDPTCVFLNRSTNGSQDNENGPDMHFETVQFLEKAPD